MKLRHMTPERGKVALIRLGYATLLATVLFCIAILSAALIHRGTLLVRLPENVSAASFAADTRTIEITERSDHTLTIRGKAPGVAELVSADGTVYMIHILPGGILYNEIDGDFSGSHAVVLIVQIYTFIMTILLGASYLIRQKIELFSYTTLYFGGASLFLCGVSITEFFRGGRLRRGKKARKNGHPPRRARRPLGRVGPRNRHISQKTRPGAS